jgi:hypothetical protein
MDIRPVPTDEEAVAIVAAVDALWPRPVLASSDEHVRVSNWRISGRWWAQHPVARRVRPW